MGSDADRLDELLCRAGNTPTSPLANAEINRLRARVAELEEDKRRQKNRFKQISPALMTSLRRKNRQRSKAARKVAEYARAIRKKHSGGKR